MATGGGLWPDLPGDLLGTVYSKLAASFDRVRFAAACRPWRAAATASRHLAPPSLPWFVYNNYYTEKHRLYCPEYRSVLTVPLLTNVSGDEFVGCHDGGWVAAATGHDRQIRIVNFSDCGGTEIALSAKQKGIAFCGNHLHPPCVIRKIIFSEPPTSGSCILAATTNSCGLALCRVGCPDIGWTTKSLRGAPLLDIAFSNGELYGLMQNKVLVKFKVGTNKDGAPVVIGDAQQLTSQVHEDPLPLMSYIVELRGKMVLMVRATSAYGNLCKVFELACGAITTCAYRWVEVTSLGDYALFFGRTWSKAVYVPTGGCGVVQRNYIYTNHLVFLINSSNYVGGIFYLHDRGDGLQMFKYAPGGSCSPERGIWLPPLDF